MMKIFLSAVLLLGSSSSFASKLGETVKLPAYLQKNYGNLDLKIKVGGQTASVTMKYRERVIGSGHRGNGSTVRVPDGLNFTIPAGLSEIQKKEAIAKALFAFLEKEDHQFRHALMDLENMRIWDPSKGEHNINMKDRVQAVFASRLSGQKPGPKDDVAQVWWKLKFEAEDTKEHSGKVKKGDPVLMVLHQTGYTAASSSLMTNIRRRLDFGHSALGIRYVGGDPKNDILLNPGSKNRDFYEAALPNSVNPEVPNMVDMDNLWKWSETQISKRYMEVDAEVLPLTKTQKEALPILIPKMKGLNLGPALAMTNNCADGAAALVNFLMPIERTFEAQVVGKVAIPARVSRKASARFQDSDHYKFPDIAKENPQKETPGLSYKDQVFARKDLSTYDKYLSFEKSKFGVK